MRVGKMNYGMIVFMLGWVCCFESVFLLLPFGVSLLYGEREGLGFLIVAVICAVIGLIITRMKPKHRTLHGKEGVVIVAFSWIVLSIFGAIPFVVSGEIPHFIDALFETMSGFTTTGASILSDVEALSKTSLFWRSFTHWIGGMGVLVFILAILPLKSGGTGGAGLHIMRAESPGPSVSKLVPKVRTTALILYAIYLAMTVVQIVILLIGGMSLFDAVTISFGTAGTGGFAIKNSSLGDYSSFLQVVVAIFMILFGVNFNVYYFILRKKLNQAFAITEMKGYFVIIGLSTLIITINITPMFSSIAEALKHALFQVGSIITTTGYASTDFNVWPELSRTTLVILMFIGACAGSTGGGIKVSRIIILFKGIKKELQRVCHPRSISKVKLDGHTLENGVVESVNAYIAIYIILFALSVLIISLDNKDLITNFTAVAATINNIGPGLEIVGPTGTFGSFSYLSKLVMIFDMLAGRLELIPILILLVPSTWRR